MATLGERPDQRAPDGGIVLHQQQLCHDTTVAAADPNVPNIRYGRTAVFSLCRSLPALNV
jgi:hypothetical protein